MVVARDAAGWDGSGMLDVAARDATRVASPDGTVLYEAGTRFLAGPVSFADSGFTSTGGRSSEGESMFVTIAYAASDMISGRRQRVMASSPPSRF